MPDNEFSRMYKKLKRMTFLHNVRIFRQKSSKLLYLLLIILLNISCKFDFSPYSDITLQSLLAPYDKTQLTSIDVVILAGQSNMAGHGISDEASLYLSMDEYDKVSKGISGINIFVCNDFTALDLGIRFLPYSKVSFLNGPYGNLFGPEVGFALECQNTGCSLVLIKYTAGGMPSDYFIEANDISRIMKSYILNCCLDLVGRGYYPNIRACCWMQGENDCDYNTSKRYYGNELTLIKYLRKSFNEKMLFIDARVTDWQLIDPYCYQDVVNSAKETIAQEDDHCFLIDSTGLVKCFDGAHYDTPSTIELARRFAKEVLSNLWRNER